MARINLNTNNSNTSNSEAWKAGGFVNAYLPGAEGPAKIGAFPLRIANADEKQLLDWAKADPAAFLEWFKANVTFDFREVREGGGKFALPEAAKPAPANRKPPF